MLPVAGTAKQLTVSVLLVPPEEELVLPVPVDPEKPVFPKPPD
jgi:hypothetical protein